ncbi:putative phosphoglycerate mutase family protein [Aspergillus campestris IBT 28561]|uniref:Phosphoglycerate mutase family protein n=1 Tax=Aspergillus campestris (strain IBT 28561) TaxID=1392248 RepID=A0A2I1D2P6_ASPC2|nr:putative phosphoglycerate mutase family protein [Aspergillus campestris IBT 28561]PKY04152.1 putative phosphoglycerate mutase family protein [Aspergillus campestris IBT 28561]
MPCPAISYYALLFAVFLSQATAWIHNTPNVYLIRHGEKSGLSKDRGLNSEGELRAECLRNIFGANSTYDIKYILAPKFNKQGYHRRSYDTVHPLAEDLGLSIDTSCKRNKPGCLVKRIKAYRGPGNILISWRHSKISAIASKLGVDEVPDYPDERFDLIWTMVYPYENVTSVESENCPGLDAQSVLRVQV